MAINYEQQAADWYEAWNSRDAQNICDLYADDLVFTSPFIRKLGLSEDGALTDIQAFYAYVSNMLPRIPNLRFEPVANCIGVQGHTLVYRNQSSHIVTETFEYNDLGLIRLANAAFSTAPIKRKNYGSR
ncbi:nuclear transport factor 2 family protein [Asticcacaulis taihuensis]|uniref:SnoaL-like domain-containing protein n=1 Tax=Asticcacaulis taihuensis TaxID=260084 RepID=A0A1G4Q3L8_9CAUL|nr:nuclear transport factor 2 family protein [Asticcacaulis taihuensis]SCW39021.1 SnoaL-like domain-containing protein [Asticcacaulis taihuensis]